MPSGDGALQALRLQTQFVIVEAAAAVARATAVTNDMQQRVQRVAVRVGSLARELRETTRNSPVNPALLMTLRRMHHAENMTLIEWRKRLGVARQEEQRERSALAELRNRERSLDRALRDAQRARRRAQQSAEMRVADDLWLQHSWREAL